MSQVRVEKLSPDDYAFAVQLTDTMGWNLVAEDFEFMRTLEPDGCLVAFAGSTRLGLSTTISYGSVGWLGNVIVREDARSQGVGSFLVQRSIGYLRSKHVTTIGLYAYSERLPFYQRLGFHPSSTYKVLKGTKRRYPTRGAGCSVSGEALERVAAFDRVCFGAPREKLLMPIIRNPENLCYAAENAGTLIGFVVCKVYDGFAEIGPLECSSGRMEVACDLLSTVLHEVQGDVSIFVPDEAQALLAALNQVGFREEFAVVTMYNGPPPRRPCVYTPESLERG
jgi:GNAT superfamily N-acetyltransferase